MSLQINFNGKTYNSIEEMPPDVLQAYQKAMALLIDQNANGMPDFIEGLLQGQSPAEALAPLQAFTASTIHYVHDGQTFMNLEDMPPEARAAYQQALGTWDQNRNGIPDALEHGPQPAGQNPPPVANVMGASSLSAVPRAQPIAAQLASEVGAGPSRIMTIVMFGLAAVCLIAALLALVFIAGPALLNLR